MYVKSQNDLGLGASYRQTDRQHCGYGTLKTVRGQKRFHSCTTHNRCVVYLDYSDDNDRLRGNNVNAIESSDDIILLKGAHDNFIDPFRTIPKNYRRING